MAGVMLKSGGEVMLNSGEEVVAMTCAG